MLINFLPIPVPLKENSKTYTVKLMTNGCHNCLEIKMNNFENDSSPAHMI